MIQTFGWEQWAPIWAFSPVLFLVVLSDFRAMRIPNGYCLAGVAIFAVSAAALDIGDLWLRVAVAGACFAICLVKFGLGWMGGGDAKFLPVVMLFVPVADLSMYLLLFAICLLLGLVGVLSARRMFRYAGLRAASMQAGAGFPMGIPIGASGLVLALISLSRF